MVQARIPTRRLTDLESEMVLANRGLVTVVLRKLQLCAAVARFFDEDDLRQVGCIGLIKAAQRFDPTRGFRFSTFAVACVFNEIRRAIQAAKRKVVGHLDHEPAAIDDVHQEAEEAELDGFVQKAIARLRPRERGIIQERYFGEGKNLAAIGRQIGLSRQRSKQLHDRALNSLRKQLEGVAS